MHAASQTEGGAPCLRCAQFCEDCEAFMETMHRAPTLFSWPAARDAPAFARSILRGLERFVGDLRGASAGSWALGLCVYIETGCAAAFAAGAGGTLMRVLETHMADAKCALSRCGLR